MPEIATPPTLPLPDALRAQGFAARTEREEDVPFLQHLYATTRERELAMLPWPPAQKDAFVLQQFEAQRRHYRAHHCGAAFVVITRNDVPVGRLYLQRGPTTYHVIDITLLPEMRGLGIGTTILQTLIAQARTEQVGVGLMVEQINPAQGLYRRLGFRQVGAGDVYLEMEWRADAPAAPQ